MPLHPLPVPFMDFGGLSGLGRLAGARVRLILISLSGVTLFAPNIVSPAPATPSVLPAWRWSLPGNPSRPAAIRLGYPLKLVALPSVMMRFATVWMRDRMVTNEGKLGNHDARSR